MRTGLPLRACFFRRPSAGIWLRQAPAGRHGRARTSLRLPASPELVARTITAVRRENEAAEDAVLDEVGVTEALGSLELG